METRLLTRLGQIAGLAGISLGVFLLLFRDFLKQNLLPRTGLSAFQAYHLLLSFLFLTFGMAAIGVVAWMIGQNNSNRSRVPNGPLLIVASLTVAVLLVAAKLAAVDEGQKSGVTHTYTNKTNADDLPPSVTDTPVQKQSLFALPFSAGDSPNSDLKNRDSLTFDHGDLIVGNIGAHKVVNLALNTLTLANGARIITNGNTISIRAQQVVVPSGSITSFDPQDAVAPPTTTINQEGIGGESGGQVILSVLEPVPSTLKANLFGQKGGQGGPGSAGAPYGQADRGEDASDTAFGCGHGGGNGAHGVNGRTGNTGARGGPGGDGGTLILRGTTAENVKFIDFSAHGGFGGDGGEGGAGGLGQKGGGGGGGSKFCGGGHGGGDGDLGAKGEKGPKGEDGSDGKKVVE